MTYHQQKGCGYGHVTVLKFCRCAGLSAIAELLVKMAAVRHLVSCVVKTLKF